LRRKPSVKFSLLTPTQNQVGRLAMLKTILRRRRRRTKKKKKEEEEDEEEEEGGGGGR
jgi:hypothetical protein